ncbi:MAG: hypothetical protein JNG84_02785 [Archangium sp.]|nr:hypothetical protein [Archangium sp.]
MSSIRKQQPSLSPVQVSTKALTSNLPKLAPALQKVPVLTTPSAAGAWAPQAGAVETTETKKAKAFDGMVRVGSGWKTSKDFSFAEAAKAAGDKGPLLYLNGICTQVNTFDTQLATLQSIGEPATGIYNATANGFFDVSQAIHNKVPVLTDKSVVSTRDMMLKALTETSGPVRVIGYSAGTIGLRRSLNQLKDALMDKAVKSHEGAGVSRKEAKKLAEADVAKTLARLQVTTFASGARRWVDGPTYTHFVAKGDSVPGLFGPTERTVAKAKNEKIVFFDPASPELGPTRMPEHPHGFANYAAALALYEKGVLTVNSR